MKSTKKEKDAAKKPRFRIEKLEERIAPAKGGIPGPPDGGGGGGGPCQGPRPPAHCR